MTNDVAVSLPRRVRAFQTCPGCDYDLATGEGERSCHYYECPYLPEELDTRCPTCLHNLAGDEGPCGCDDDAARGFARDVAPERVRMLRLWLAEHT